MTTYAYHIALNDREVIAVRNALSWYLEICKSGPPEELRAHHSPHPHAIAEVLSRLYYYTEMTSTSSFCLPENK